MALQRNLKALGTFGYQTTTRGNPVYMQYVPAHAGLRAAHARPRSALRPPRRTARRSRRRAAVQFPAIVSAARFSVSTYLFHQSRLDREHLVEIAAHGFDAIELFALRSHFDYTDPAAVQQLGEWLDDTRLTLAAVHAPTAEAFDGQWRGSLSLAAGGNAARLAAVDETWAAIDIATDAAATTPWWCISACRSTWPHADDNDAGGGPREPRRADAVRRRARRADRARGADQPAVDTRRAGRPHRGRGRLAGGRHLRRHRPRPAAGRSGRRHRVGLGPHHRDARQRQPRLARRSPGALRRLHRLGSHAAGLPQGGLRRALDVRSWRRPCRPSPRWRGPPPPASASSRRSASTTS